MACRVAVCDDADVFRLMLRVALDLEPDLEVVGEAATGLEAVELARGMRPDVLILDVAMPDLDGLEALPLIREASPETQVLMLSGFSHDDVKARALSLGAVRYLEKGIAPQTIAQEIRNACAAVGG